MYYTLKFLFGNVKTSDVLYFTVYRTPIVKLASYAIAKINVSPNDAHDILAKINEHQDIIGDVEIWFAKSDSDHMNEQQLISRKKYNMIYASPINQSGDTVIDNKYKLSTTLFVILVNPILMQMQRNVLINQIFKNKTCKQILESVENEFKKSYGDVFQFDKLAQRFNTFIYEQVLINSLRDIEIPTWLINTYKLTDGFPIYFFDDFDLHNVNKPIRALVFDPTNLESFKHQDVSSLIENYGATPIRRFPITDLFQNVVKSDDKQILINSDFQQHTSLTVNSSVQTGTPELLNYSQDPTSSARSHLYNSSLRQMFNQKVSGAKQRIVGWIPDHIEHFNKRKKVIEEALKQKYQEMLLVKYTGAPIDIFKIGNRYPIIDSKGSIISTNAGLMGAVISFKRMTLRETKMQAVATCQYLVFRHM